MMVLCACPPRRAAEPPAQGLVHARSLKDAPSFSVSRTQCHHCAFCLSHIPSHLKPIIMVPKGLLSCNKPRFTDGKAESLVAIHRASAEFQTRALSINLHGSSQDTLVLSTVGKLRLYQVIPQRTHSQTESRAHLFLGFLPPHRVECFLLSCAVKAPLFKACHGWSV